MTNAKADSLAKIVQTIANLHNVFIMFATETVDCVRNVKLGYMGCSAMKHALHIV